MKKAICLTNSQGLSLDNKELGDLGEKLAAHALVREGRKILYRNYRGPKGGELDLVARDGDVLTFIEVKTRRKGGVGRPLDAVNSKKRSLIRRGGQAWLKLLRHTEIPWRYDVVEVLVEEGKQADIRIIENIETDQKNRDGAIFYH